MVPEPTSDDELNHPTGVGVDRRRALAAMGSKRSRLNTVLPLTVSLTATSVFFINLCAAIFRCGCRALWAGADAACNIHAPSGHHCPWCAHGTAGYTAVMVLLCAPQLAVSLW